MPALADALPRHPGLRLKSALLDQSVVAGHREHLRRRGPLGGPAPSRAARRTYDARPSGPPRRGGVRCCPRASPAVGPPCATTWTPAATVAGISRWPRSTAGAASRAGGAVRRSSSSRSGAVGPCSSCQRRPPRRRPPPQRIALARVPRADSTAPDRRVSPGCRDRVVAGVIGHLGQTKLLEQRGQVHAEPSPVALALSVPSADGVVRGTTPRLTVPAAASFFSSAAPSGTQSPCSISHAWRSSMAASHMSACHRPGRRAAGDPPIRHGHRELELPGGVVSSHGSSWVPVLALAPRYGVRVSGAVRVQAAQAAVAHGPARTAEHERTRSPSPVARRCPGPCRRTRGWRSWPGRRCGCSW